MSDRLNLPLLLHMVTHPLLPPPNIHCSVCVLSCTGQSVQLPLPATYIYPPLPSHSNMQASLILLTVTRAKYYIANVNISYIPPSVWTSDRLALQFENKTNYNFNRVIRVFRGGCFAYTYYSWGVPWIIIPYTHTCMHVCTGTHTGIRTGQVFWVCFLFFLSVCFWCVFFFV